MRDPSLLDPDIRAYLEAENAYAQAALAPTEPLQDALFAEMRGRIKEDDAGVPAADGPFAYFSRHREGGQHPLICREPRAGGPAETIARWRRARRRQIVLPHRSHRAFARSPAARLELGRQRRRALLDPRPRYRARRRPAGPRHRDDRRHRVVAGCERLLLRPSRPQSPPGQRASPSPRHQRGRRRDDRRRRRQRPLRVARRGAVRPLCGSLAARPRELGKLADRPRSRRRSAARRAARTVGALPRRASSRASAASPASSSSPTPMAPRTSRSPGRRSRRAAATVGATSSPTGRASTS